MKSKHNRILSLLPVAALVVAGSAQASLIISAAEFHGSGVHFGVSNTDLVNTGSSALTGTTSSQATPNWGTTVNGAHDGIHTQNFGTYSGQYAVNSGTTLTFDLGGNPAGYDISSIISLSGYADPTDRISQKYNVEYSLVGSAAWNALAGDITGATVNRAWVKGGTENYVGELQVTISDMSLTGVDGLRFTFYNYAAVAIYQEIDVTGTLTAIPEPGSLLALGCLLGSGVCLRSRRRR